MILGEDPTAGGSREPVKTALSFYEIGIPRGSTIISSRIRFEVDAVDVAPCKLYITVEDSKDTARLTNANHEVSKRMPVNFTGSPTPTSVDWTVQEWNSPHVFRYMPCIGEAKIEGDPPPGCGENGVSLNPLVQRIVNQREWRKMHDIMFHVEGKGTRRAQSSKNQALGPELQVKLYTPGVDVSPSILADLRVQQPFPDPEDWAHPHSKAKQRYLTHIILCSVAGLAISVLCLAIGLAVTLNRHVCDCDKGHAVSHAEHHYHGSEIAQVRATLLIIGPLIIGGAAMGLIQCGLFTSRVHRAMTLYHQAAQNYSTKVSAVHTAYHNLNGTAAFKDLLKLGAFSACVKMGFTAR